MEEGLWMQHQLEPRKRGDSGQGSSIYWLFNSSLEYLSPGKQLNKTHEEALGKKARGGVDNQHRALSLIRRLLGHQYQQQ